MAQELPALAKSSLQDGPESEKMTAHDEVPPAAAEEAKPAAWRPRWRGNPDAKPTPYKPKPDKNGFIAPESGEHRAQDISERLNGQSQHSFMIEKTSPHEGTTATEEGALDAAGNPPRIVTMKYHRGSNPIPKNAAASDKEIWTRNNQASVQASIGLPIPLYTYSTNKGSEELWKRKRSTFYVYAGMYEIESATLAKGGSPEVAAFLTQREESQREREAEIWKNKFHSDWLKVRVVKCKPELQKPDPMLSGTVQSSDT